jgi:hypothetical protein
LKTTYNLNLWDCPNCGAMGVPATTLECPGCGGAKTPQNLEYLGPELTREEAMKWARAKKFIVCSSCGMTNRGGVTACEKCGNGIDASDKKYGEINYGTPDQAPRSEDEARRRFEPETSSGYERGVTSSLPRADSYGSSSTSIGSVSLNSDQKQMLKLGAGAFLGFILLFWVVYAVFFQTEQKQGLVVGYAWTWDVEIERYQTNHYSRRSSHPGDAFNVRSYKESRLVEVYRTETETRYVSKTCSKSTNLGNGITETETWECGQDVTTSKKVFDHYDTVWDTYYDYDVNEWSYLWTAHSEGTDQSPKPPSFTLNLEGQTALGAERAKPAQKHFTVIFRVIGEGEDPDEYVYKTDNESEWLQYQIESWYPLKINRQGTVMNNPLLDKINAEENPAVIQ